jgi:hypothetical protein
MRLFRRKKAFFYFINVHKIDTGRLCNTIDGILLTDFKAHEISDSIRNILMPNVAEEYKLDLKVVKLQLAQFNRIY